MFGIGTTELLVLAGCVGAVVAPLVLLLALLRRRRATGAPVIHIQNQVHNVVAPGVQPGGCRRCGAALGPGARFCAACGSPV